MNSSKAVRMACWFIVLGLLVSVGLLLVAGCDPTGTSQVVEQGQVLEQKAYDAATQANLRIINSAIQVYYTQYEKWPTDMSQLTEFFGGKVPTDPSGKTYYIMMVNGEAKAGVK